VGLEKMRYCDLLKKVDERQPSCYRVRPPELTNEDCHRCLHLRDHNIGLGRYCHGLIEAIGRIDTENRYEILMPDDSYRFPKRPNVRYRLIRFPLFKRRFWEQITPFTPLLVGRYDLLHFPYDFCIA